MNKEKTTKFAIPKSIPLKYHTVALENIYALMGFLADGILSNKQSLGRLEAQADHIEQDISVMKTDIDILKTDVGALKIDVDALKTGVGNLKIDLKSTEDRLSKKIETAIEGPRKEILKLNKEVFG